MNNELETIIQVLLSSDNKRRQEAESLVNTLPQTNYEQFIDALLMSMDSQNEEVAQMAALLLKKKYLDSNETLSQMSQAKMAQIIERVQIHLGAQKKLPFLKRCSDIIVKLLIKMNKKKEILTMAVAMSQSLNTVTHKLCLMYFIEIACQYAFDDDATLMENSAVLQQIFQKGLQDENNEVRVASFKTLTIFLSSIEDEGLIKKFEGVLQMLLTKCIEAIKYDQETGKTALSSLCQLIEVHPKFIKPVLNDLLRVFGQIMDTQMLSSNLRITAMHGILLLCMNHESLIRKNQYFKGHLVQTYMKMLSEAGKVSSEEWSNDLNPELISKDDVSMATEEHLCQILVHLGTKFLLPLFINYISVGIASNNPNDQHAGLVAMALLTEGCHDIFKNELNNIVKLVAPLADSTNPRVFNDVIVVFGSLCQQFGPDVQVQYGQQILGLIERGLENPLPKVQMNAIKSIQNYCNKLEDNQEAVNGMLPHLDRMLNAISNIFSWALKQSNFLMMDAILNTLISISSIASFEKYYNNFMPGLKTLISMMSADNPQQNFIRARTVQCVGFLLASIKNNEQLFVQECQTIMESLLTMQQTLEQDDSLHSAMFKVYKNLVTIMKENFPYCDRIINKVVQATGNKVDCRIVDEGETKNIGKKINKFFNLKYDMGLDGGMKNIILNTDSLEQKLEGANLMVALASNMGMNFAPFIERSIDVVSSHLSFKHSKELRHNMIVMVNLMISACQNQQQRNFVLEKTMQGLMNEFTQVLKLKSDEDMQLILEVLAGVMPYCPEPFIASLPQYLNTALTVTRDLVSEIEKEYASKEMDDDLQNEMDEAIEEVEQTYEKVEDIMKLAQNRPEYQALRKAFPQDYEFTQ